MSTLGKRKEREGDHEAVHGSTLFVSNLPYTATSVDIQTLFSDIAPVRSAFVVLEQGGVSKGVGYVSFATKEDAQGAFDKIAAEGISLLGRNLRVQWAEKKPKDKDTTVKKESKPPSLRLPHPRNPSDPLAIRTAVITGLPESIDSKSLWKKFRKYEGAEKIEWPVPTDGVDDTNKAHVLFKTSANAQKAVEKIHAHVFKGSFLSAALKKRLDSIAKPTVVNMSKKSATVDASRDSTVATPSRNPPSSSAPNHASRLIVRNIPFNATEQDLRAVFLPYGPIYSIHIPSSAPTGVSEGSEKNPKDDTGVVKKITAGFAFVWMLSKKDAEKAIEGCNGTVIRAGMADTMVLDKQKRKKQRREEKKQMAQVKVEEDVEVDGGEEVGNPSKERAIAVDWALSKGKWVEEKAKMLQEEEVKEEDEDEDDLEMGTGMGTETSDDGDEDSSDDDHTSGGSNDESGSEASDDLEDKPVKPQLPPPETGTTLFIRNVPFTATEDELRTLFRAFGPLRYARLTVDGTTGRPRGTGFICFWNKEDADKVIQQSDLLRVETAGTDAPKKNPFALPSILTPDPSSTLAQDLVLHGRTLDVARAVTRDEATKLREEGEKKREKADKRNMHLLKEGVVTPNSPGAERLTPADIEKRARSINARRQLLQSNPSLYISKVRLSVRQIPIFVTERVLKRLAVHATREFEKEVDKGVRAKLTEDELAEASDEEEETKEKSGKDQLKKKGIKKMAGRHTKVKQVKIVRQPERVDSVTGKGRSKGYGFIEMHKHADALRVLRWVNNNSGVGALFEEWRKDELRDLIELEKAKVKETKDSARLKRMQDELATGAVKSKGTLIVEFSIENVQVVHRRNALQKERDTWASLDRKSHHRPQDSRLAGRESEQPPSKKRRVSEDTPAPTAKPGALIGTLIGRKRKQRKIRGKH